MCLTRLGPYSKRMRALFSGRSSYIPKGRTPPNSVTMSRCYDGSQGLAVQARGGPQWFSLCVADDFHTAKLLSLKQSRKSRTHPDDSRQLD